MRNAKYIPFIIYFYLEAVDYLNPGYPNFRNLLGWGNCKFCFFLLMFLGINLDEKGRDDHKNALAFDVHKKIINI